MFGGQDPVAGRVASPYRGHAGDEPPDASRAPSPPRPRAAVIAALTGLSRVTLEAGDDRVTLRRDPGEELVVGLPAAAEVALADLTFTGNEYIAMLAFDALVPLFGPLSFALGDYTDLVDGTEPGAATTRYQAHMRVKAEALLEWGASVYVGDHTGDVRGARTAGALSVAVTTGPCDAAELRAAGADGVRADLTEFPAWCAEYAAAAA